MAFMPISLPRSTELSLLWCRGFLFGVGVGSAGKPSAGFPDMLAPATTMGVNCLKESPASRRKEKKVEKITTSRFYKRWVGAHTGKETELSSTESFGNLPRDTY